MRSEIQTTDNQEQIDYWNAQAGSTWADAQERMDLMLAPITDLVIDRAAAAAGERVIDVGCGCGDTTLRLAAAGAAVWGVDISAPMLERAQTRAGQVPDAAVAFTLADAAVQPMTPDHQLVFSRFGVMFFADPVAAFSNLRSGLVSGGRLCFVCWQPPRNNPWMSIAGAAVQPFLPEPAQPLDPRAPGPFAFADTGYVEQVLGQAGFTAVNLESIKPTLHLADTLADAMRFQGEIGPVARALSELTGDSRRQALAAAESALAQHMDKNGPGLHLGAACWIVTAQNTA